MFGSCTQRVPLFLFSILGVTSNLVFSQWEQIFKDPMTTAAAIDRVVHHSIIVEFGKEIPSHRAQQAAQRIQLETPE
jgi:DNA replication protein DnaC